jgi:hypothetical protein
MKDILGRELKDGDLCIGMAIGRDSRGMHIGVFKGSSVVHLSRNEKSISKSCTSNTYLIENPTEEELIIKDKVQRLLIEEEIERQRKASLKTIPLSKLEVGGIYKTTQDITYMYLGKRKVIFEDLWRRTKSEEEGHCFAYVYSIKDKTDDEILDDILNINTYSMSHNIDVLKGNKKLTEMVRKVNLEFPLVKTEESSYRYSDEKYRLTIE